MKIYDSATKSYKSIGNTKRIIKIFICGPTIYNSLHLGHARVFLVYDALIRFLSFNGIKSRTIVNITDIDWKIEDRAELLKIPVKNIIDYYYEKFLIDIHAIGLTDKIIFAKVSNFMDTSILIINKTMKDKRSYMLGGNVYLKNKYNRNKYFSKKIESQEFDISRVKKKATDILLWNSYDTFGQLLYFTRDLPAGIPWWHLQDVSVIMELFKGKYDIHGGATELISPHHITILSILQTLTNERNPVGLWMHIGILKFKNKKMSKSGDNVITIDNFLQKYNSNVLRLYLYSKNYHQDMEFSEDELEKYKIIDQKICIALQMDENDSTKIMNVDQRHLMEKFKETLEDNFNTAKAIKILYEALKENHTNMLKQISEVFGLRY